MKLGTGRVALTFDMEHPSRSGHSHDAPESILDSLKRTHSRATFFVQGRWAKTEPRLTKRVVDDGHLLGCHSHFHAPMVSLTDDGIRADVEAATTALTQITGVEPRPWFRCPFGLGHDDARVLNALSECGYRNVHWNVEPQDWLETKTPDDLIASICADVDRQGDGSIVLLHTWPAATAAALPILLERLTGSGYEFVGVDELETNVASGRD